MHFNDLLMRLRSQSLTGVAALSTIVGVLAKGDVAAISVSWFVAAMIFVAMGLYWIAIWCLDFLYYNRLLRGAVAALRNIEAASQDPAKIFAIDMSTTIEEEFDQDLTPETFRHFRGVFLFYAIVLSAIIAGGLFCLWMHWQTDP